MSSAQFSLFTDAGVPPRAPASRQHTGIPHHVSGPELASCQGRAAALEPAATVSQALASSDVDAAQERKATIARLRALIDRQSFALGAVMHGFEPADGMVEAAQGRRQSVRPWRLGLPAIDRTLGPKGLSRSGVHEIKVERVTDVGGAALFIFNAVKALQECATVTGLDAREAAKADPFVWCVSAHDAQETGLPCAEHLVAMGLSEESFIFVRTRNRQDVLWAGEQALRSRAFGGVVLVTDRIDLEAARRLKLAAAIDAGCSDASARSCPCFLLPLCPHKTTPAVATRWHIRGVGSASQGQTVQRAQAGLMARSSGGTVRPLSSHPVFQLRLSRANRGLVDRNWMVEWCHGSSRLRVASRLCDGALQEREKIVIPAKGPSLCSL